MKIAAVSLGCDKNRVDLENMLYILKDSGYILTPGAEDADVIIINTCGFIEKAKREAIDTISEMLDYKAKGKKLIVTGCMAQRYADELKEGFPEVDAIVGINANNSIAEILKQLSEETIVVKMEKEREFLTGRILTTPQHYAYLRIADGCDNRCTYCAIPYIRGKYRSVEMEKVLEEAAYLAGKGVKELIIVAQDTTRYGQDLYGKPMLTELIKKLSELNIWKIRLLYAYPELITDELIDEIATNGKIAKYLDIPLQHISDKVLKRMNRRSKKEGILTLLDKLKNRIPDMAVRTTFITGFCSESDEEFNELSRFLSETEMIRYAGFFAYSPEENTPAAKFKDRPPKKIAVQRQKELEKLWSKKLVGMNQNYVGSELEVIYEGIDYGKQLFYGRSEFQAPEIDTLVYFKSDIPVEVGCVYKVKIHSADFNLYGAVTGEVL